jgi:hypothetical protein
MLCALAAVGMEKLAGDGGQRHVLDKVLLAYPWAGSDRNRSDTCQASTDECSRNPRPDGSIG